MQINCTIRKRGNWLTAPPFRIHLPEKLSGIYFFHKRHNLFVAGTNLLNGNIIMDRVPYALPKTQEKMDILAAEMEEYMDERIRNKK